MHWIFILMIVQVLSCFTISRIREVTFKRYLTDLGYKYKAKIHKEKIAEFLFTYIKVAIPFWGAVVLLVVLFAEDKTLFDAGIAKGKLEKINNQ